jgi:ribosomal protein S18 acetylase RimI-like enzyme
MSEWLVRPFDDADEDAVVALWERCGVTRPWNDPHRDIARKRLVQREFFLVADAGGDVVGTAMFGYEGHRGWVNYLATDPAWRRRGIAAELMSRGEALLTAVGCPKLNLQMRAGNADAAAFYEGIGYARDDVVCYGKRLIPDGGPADRYEW